ncbi:hypothetical protein CYMTET_25260 [Cymbomonas tetramitiformis]|uniref:Cyclic nucleotide-binding domain-containing protein n=1 Tax=Cymbomonas tetramitiformis TaxID=36881 RepID=A0AAE0FUE5_9CHLO|nr:hypothetical protein CYMTET_25260 [Cymbomonas tetramitiformis]|eukprot:gene4948-6031_t
MADTLSSDVRQMYLKRLRALTSLPSSERRHEDLVKIAETTIHLCQFFRTLPDGMQEAMCRCITFETIPKGETIFHEGDVGEKFYVVVSGKVDVLVRGDASVKDTIERGPHAGLFVAVTLGSGDAFGEIALMRSEPRSATVAARTRCEVLTVTKDSFQEVLEQVYGTSLNDKLKFLNSLNILRGRPAKRIIQLAHFLNVSSHISGTVFYPDKDLRICFVVDGECRLRCAKEDRSLPSIDGGSHFYDTNTISRLGPGSWFGESCLFEDLKRNFTVETKVETTLFSIGKQEALKYLEPSVRHKMRDEALFRVEYYDGRQAGRLEHVENRKAKVDTEEINSDDESLSEPRGPTIQDRWRAKVLNTEVTDEGSEKFLLEHLRTLKEYTNESVSTNEDRWKAEGVHGFGFQQAREVASLPLRSFKSNKVQTGTPPRGQSSNQAPCRKERKVSMVSPDGKIGKDGNADVRKRLHLPWIHVASAELPVSALELSSSGSKLRTETSRVLSQSIPLKFSHSSPGPRKQRESVPVMSNFGVVKIPASEGVGPVQGQWGLLQVRRTTREAEDLD